MALGDYGARVIKVEEPDGDETRRWGPPFLGEDAAYFFALNRNKESVVLDLKRPEDHALLLSIARTADIVVENFRPGTLDRLGCGWEALRAVNPRIILCSISGFGQTGPKSRLPGFDQIAQGMGGLMSVTGEADGPPVRSGFAVADLAASMWALYGIMLALRQRDLTGEGQWIDVALLDSIISFQTFQAQNYFATSESPKRHGGAHPNIVPYQVFDAQDGPFNLAVASEIQWRRLCTALDLGISDDPRFSSNRERVRNRTEVIAVLSAIFKERRLEDLLPLLWQHEIPAGPIYRIGDVFSDPQVLDRGLVQQVEHPTLGTLNQVRAPLRMSMAEPVMRTPPPRRDESGERLRREFSTHRDDT